jgi:hypothetical protein
LAAAGSEAIGSSGRYSDLAAVDAEKAGKTPLCPAAAIARTALAASPSARVLMSSE